MNSTRQPDDDCCPLNNTIRCTHVRYNNENNYDVSADYRNEVVHLAGGQNSSSNTSIVVTLS